MNRDFFKSGDDIIIEGQQLIKQDVDHAHDRAAIAAFYNGKSTMTDCEAEERGVNELTNHLFGYDSISTAAEQLASIATKAPILWNVEVTGGPPEDRHRTSLEVTKHWNLAMIRSGRFQAEWKSVSGEITLFGKSHLLFTDQEDWCPVMRTLYVPPDTKTGCNPDYICMPDEISLDKLEEMLAHAEAEDDGDYNAKGIRDAIKTLKDDFAPGENQQSGTSPDYRPDKAEQDRQEGASMGGVRKNSIPVYYMYQARHDEPGCPYDLTIVSRYTAKQLKRREEGNETKDPDPVLYDAESEFSSAKNFIHSYFVDVNIGMKSTWALCSGLGHINYDSDVDVEEFFNEAMQGSKEGLRSQYQISSGADRETLERWLGGDGYSNILPEGVTTAESRRNPNFQHSFTVLEMLSQSSKRNAHSSLSNSDVGGKLDELEVQALERQGRNAEAVANRINTIYLTQDSLGEEIFRRFCTAIPMPIDSGYDEIHYFQESMKEAGISLDFLSAKRNGVYTNVKITVNRVAGDGGAVKQRMVDQFLMTNISMFSAGARQEILKRVTSNLVGDYDFVDRLVPEVDKPILAQRIVATNENDEADRYGISQIVTGQPFQIDVNDEDIHEEHLGFHLAGLVSYIAVGQSEGWTMKDQYGFLVIANHAALHVEAMKGSIATKQIARQYEATLQQYVSQGQEFAAALQQKQEAQQQEVDPVAVEKLRISQEKLQLEQRAQQAIEYDRDVKNTQKAQEAAAKGAREEGKLSQAERKLQVERAEKQVAMAKVIAGDQDPQGAPPNEA